MASKAAKLYRNQPLTRERYFSVMVKLPTDEVFQLKNVYNDMKISELKGQVEFAAGIPYHLQRLSYLDDGDLMDNTDVRSNDIVSGGTLNLRVWHQWDGLLEAAAACDIDAIMKLGIGKHHTYKTPISEYMSARSKKEWLAERAFVAMFIAAHRGHQTLCQKIIEAGVDINATTPLGRSALHVAAARGHGTIIDFLLEKGADIDAVDERGNTALAIAMKFENKDCERHLFLFRWQERAKNTKPNSEKIQRMAHQYCDSKFPVWLEGTQGQIYYTNLLPPQEFQGTMFHSPKVRHRPGSASSEHEQYTPSETDNLADEHTQVTLGKETLQYAMELEAEANKTSDYLQSLVFKKPFSRKAVKMPPIEERSDIGSSKSNKVRGGEDVKHRRHGLSTHAGGKDKVRNYDTWLAEKKRKEQIQKDTKAAIETERKRQEEDIEQEKEFQQLGYEGWLKQKQDPKKKHEGNKYTGKKESKKPEVKTYDSWLIQKEVELLEKVKHGIKA